MRRALVCQRSDENIAFFSWWQVTGNPALAINPQLPLFFYFFFLDFLNLNLFSEAGPKEMLLSPPRRRRLRARLGSFLACFTTFSLQGSTAHKKSERKRRASVTAPARPPSKSVMGQLHDGRQPLPAQNDQLR